MPSSGLSTTAFCSPWGSPGKAPRLHLWGQGRQQDQAHLDVNFSWLGHLTSWKACQLKGWGQIKWPVLVSSLFGIYKKKEYQKNHFFLSNLEFWNFLVPEWRMLTNLPECSWSIQPAIRNHLFQMMIDVTGQCPAGTRTRPATRYFFRYPTRPDSVLEIIG